MRVMFTGATGFLGRPLVAFLAGLGYECIVCTRDSARAAQQPWPASTRIVSAEEFPAAEAIIHLAGESVVGYWTPRKRQAILASRVEGTRRLVQAIGRVRTRPHTLLSASAVGIYGHRPGEMLEETSPADPRNGFRAQVCQAWEEEAKAAERFGIRVINLRLGNIFDPGGGYLGGLLPIYRRLGGWMFGAPDAAIPWIALEDAVQLIGFALANERWYGPLNLVAPQSVTHREMVEGIGSRVGLHGARRVPQFLTRGVLGEFASTLTDDQCVMPAKAIHAGFGFQHPTFQSWLDAAMPLDATSASCQRVPIRSQSECA